MSLRKILIILDLDETLIYSTEKRLDREEDFVVFHYHVYKRPYLDTFLTFCHLNFDVAIWSSASDDYVQAISQKILDNDIQPKFIWGRSRCTPKVPRDFQDVYTFGNYEYTKQLYKLKKRDFDLERVLIIDDTPAKVVNSYGNAIYPKEYHGEKEDDELLYLQKYLDQIKNIENVRSIEKRGWRNHINIPEISPKI